MDETCAGRDKLFCTGLIIFGASQRADNDIFLKQCSEAVQKSIGKGKNNERE